MSHVIPDFIYKAIVKQTPFEIFGDGRQVRTFTHAKDISEALRAILEKELRNDDFNICGASTENVEDLAKKIWAAQVTGRSIPTGQVDAGSSCGRALSNRSERKTARRNRLGAEVRHRSIIHRRHI